MGHSVLGVCVCVCVCVCGVMLDIVNMVQIQCGVSNGT